MSGSGAANLQYVLATSGRTGSNLLQRLLDNNGLNNPHEWFHSELFGFAKAAESGITTEQWLERMRREHTRDGVFAIKLMTNHPREIRPFMATPVESEQEVVRTLFPDAKFIFLRRKDVDRQAVSIWRAQVTGKWIQWAAESERPRERPPLDLEAVEHHVNRIKWANRFWRQHFRRYGIEPFRLTYEQFDADWRGSILQVAEFLGRPIQGEPDLSVDIVRQADDITEGYLRELREARERRRSSVGV